MFEVPLAAPEAFSPPLATSASRDFFAGIALTNILGASNIQTDLVCSPDRFQISLNVVAFSRNLSKLLCAWYKYVVESKKISTSERVFCSAGNRAVVKNIFKCNTTFLVDV